MGFTEFMEAGYALVFLGGVGLAVAGPAGAVVGFATGMVVGIAVTVAKVIDEVERPNRVRFINK